MPKTQKEKDPKKVAAGRKGGLAGRGKHCNPYKGGKPSHLHDKTWMSLVTGFISTCGAVARHNTARDIQKDAKVQLSATQLELLLPLDATERVSEYEAKR